MAMTILQGTAKGTLVGGEFSQSLGSRLLVSVLRLWGLFAIKDTFVITLGNQMNALIVILGSM